MIGDRRLGLVLGGGGIAGIAWHTGLLCGLAKCGADLTAAHRLIGTSAGATVAAQIGGGCSVDELFNRQVDPTTLTTEIIPRLSVAELWELMVPIYAESADEDERRRRLGRLALDAPTVDEAVRRRSVAARLEGVDWWGDHVAVVACEATTGAFGADVLDPAVREPSARAGWAQGLREAERIVGVLTD